MPIRDLPATKAQEIGDEPAFARAGFETEETVVYAQHGMTIRQAYKAAVIASCDDPALYKSPDHFAAWVGELADALLREDEAHHLLRR